MFYVVFIGLRHSLVITIHAHLSIIYSLHKAEWKNPIGIKIELDNKILDKRIWKKSFSWGT